MERLNRNMRSIGIVVAAAALVGVAGVPGTARAAEPMTAERIVAVVNSDVVLLSELEDRARLVGQAVDESLPEAERRKQELALRGVLDKMVDDVLITQQATELKLAVEQSEVDRAIDEVRKQNNLTEDQFAEALKGQGYSIAAYRRELKKQILRLKVINTAVRSRIQVSDEDVRSYYNANARKAGGTKSAHLRHVFVAAAPGEPAAALERKKQLAQKVIDEARGGKDFAELARLYSDDEATKDKGGDLGWVDEGIMADEMVAAIAGAKNGDLRGPVRTPRGFEVIQLVEAKDGDVRPFDEVKEQLRQQLYSQQLEKNTASWLAEVRKKAHIDIRL